MKQGLPQVYKYKVVILSITYNQSQYIEDTLNGFVMQRTDFPFICCVFDDASTDGEQDVLRQWIDNHCYSENVEIYNHPLATILMAPDKNNPNCIYAIHLHKVNLFGKPEKQELINYWNQFGEYIAMCEGDDYWIDPYKLQKQVDFLEKNPDYVMCCSDAKIITKKKELNWCRYKINREIPIKDIILGGGLYVQTVSLLYNRSLISANDYPEKAKKCHVGDYPLQIFAALKGKIYWFAEKQVVYRYETNNSWTKTSKEYNIERLILGWLSEINMLKGMDEYSQYQYSKYFKQRQVLYIYDKYVAYPECYRIIDENFAEIKRMFSFKQKIILFLIKKKIWYFLKLCKSFILNKKL